MNGLRALIDLFRGRKPAGRMPAKSEIQKVFTSQSVVPCDMIKGILEAEGITCFIKNERASTPAGEGLPITTPLTWAWPELWVKSEDFERAREVVAAFANGKPEEQEAEGGSDDKQDA